TIKGLNFYCKSCELCMWVFPVAAYVCFENIGMNLIFVIAINITYTFFLEKILLRLLADQHDKQLRPLLSSLIRQPAEKGLLSYKRCVAFFLVYVLSGREKSIVK
ncbi:MAG: hypothetical protein JWQ06_161, partial [Mucilaginibacter sp.]|nr:hypothetical protein [Mucilaginibacter sp.]